MVDAANPEDEASAAATGQNRSNLAALSDEEAADRARARYRTGIPLMAPDAVLVPYLEIGEEPFDYREYVTLSTLDDATTNGAKSPGPLYVTDRRILLLGSRTTSIRLSEITELTVTDSSLLVGLVNAGGVIIELTQPRRLRALLAAAKAAARGAAADGNDGV